MKFILTWESCCEMHFEEFNNLPAAEMRAKEVLQDDLDIESVTISKGVKKFTRKIVEEKLDD